MRAGSYDIATAHADPFDRLLLAQAIVEPLYLLSDSGENVLCSAKDSRLADIGTRLKPFYAGLCGRTLARAHA